MKAVVAAFNQEKALVGSKSWIVKKCKKIFYHLFNRVKYLYLPSDIFRKHVVMHVTYRKLALKFTGYCRQTSYTDSTVIHTLVPAVAWELRSQFAPGYMHFNIFSEGVCGKIWIFHNGKMVIELFFLLRLTIGFCYFTLDVKLSLCMVLSKYMIPFCNQHT